MLKWTQLWFFYPTASFIYTHPIPNSVACSKTQLRFANPCRKSTCFLCPVALGLMQDILSRNISFFCSFLTVVSLSGQASPPKWISGSCLGTDSLWKTEIPFCSSAIYVYVHVRTLNHSFSKKNEMENAIWQLFLESLSGVKAKKPTRMRTCTRTHFADVSAAPSRTEWTLWSTQQALQWGRELLSEAQRGVCSAEEALCLDSLLRSLAIQQFYQESPSLLLLFKHCFCLADDKWTKKF